MRCLMLTFATLAAFTVQARAQTVVDPTRPAGPGQQYGAGQQNTDGDPRPNQRRPIVQAGRAAVQAGLTAAQTAQGQDLNRAIAGCLLLGNQEEIALAEFAQSRTQNPRVKEFAQMMIDQHQQAVAKLTPLAPELAALSATLRGQAGAQNPAGAPAAELRSQDAAAGQSVFALQQRVTRECLALTQQELGQKKGAEFDQCYMASQVGAHIGMLAKLRGSQQFATGELQQLIQQTEPTVLKHLDHAKQIAKELKSEGAPRQTSQRPTATAQPIR